MSNRMDGSKFKVAVLSDSGLVAKVNEDSCAGCVQMVNGEEIALLVVADGVGGLEAGDKASALAVEAVKDAFTQSTKQSMKTDDIFTSVVNRVEEVNAEIIRFAQKKGTRCGTTLTWLLVSEQNYCFYHVGDSRIYILPDGMFSQLTSLTKDHSETIPKQTAGGQIVMKTYLTDCVGFKRQFRYQQGRGTASPKDIFLLCTDGIYKKQPDSVLQKVIRRRRNDMGALCRDLVGGAKQAGETDNLTAAAIRMI